MKSRRVNSALEPIIILGILVSFAILGIKSMGALISRNVLPLASVPLIPEEPTPVALAQDESLTTKKR